MTDDPFTTTTKLMQQLRLRDALQALEDHLPDDVSLRNRVLEVVASLLTVEASKRRERRIKRRIDYAKLPDHPTLEAFDFDFQPGLDKNVVMNLATMNWVERAEDLLLLGQSGVGKSHVAKALCLRACAADYIARYTTCADLMTDLVASLATNSLADRLKRYTRPQLLLIDDLGYDPIEQEQAREAQLLYKVLDARHGKVSTIVTSNLPVDEWPNYLGSKYLTVALLDRLLYRATTISIEGPSYRLAQHDKRHKATRPRKSPKKPSPKNTSPKKTSRST